jgi:hypothetical protein
MTSTESVEKRGVCGPLRCKASLARRRGMYHDAVRVAVHDGGEPGPLARRHDPSACTGSARPSRNGDGACIIRCTRRACASALASCLRSSSAKR